MGTNQSASTVSFWARVQWAFKILFDPELAGRLAVAESARDQKAETAPPAKQAGPALTLLAAFQREGRFLDFLQQEIATFSDEDVGAAARIVHSGCRKVLHQLIRVEPIRTEEEGSPVQIPKGFDPQRIRLTGNVTGEAPFRGTLKHHGWVAADLQFPKIQESLDLRVLAPAEVELT